MLFAWISSYVEMQAVMLVTLSITFLCPLETLSSLLCVHFPSVVLVVVLFWEVFIHLHFRLKSFWWLLLINHCRWSCSVFEAVEMSTCPCCFCLRVCVAALLFLPCSLQGCGGWRWWRGWGGGRIQHLLGLNHEQMGQFGVLLQALCPRVLLISTFFFPPPRGPPGKWC